MDQMMDDLLKQKPNNSQDLVELYKKREWIEEDRKLIVEDSMNKK